MTKTPFKLLAIVILTLFAVQKARAQEDALKIKGITISDSTGIDKVSSDTISTSKLANDSISAKPDSIKNKDSLDAPVYWTAKDSMIMVMDSGNILSLYGSANIKYKDMTLNAEHIEMDADSSRLYAHFGVDSVDTKFGYPVFKSGEQQMEMEELWYNFKTKKMYTINAITQQGEGYVTAGVAKKMPDDSFFMQDGIYTTCDNHEHPHFCFVLTRAKLRPGKNVVTGPVYLKVEDVPLPFALPFGFFPASSKNYASGILMPTYADEMARGFSLRDGGYYFAFNDYIDLALRGQIYTKGSWGVSATSSYKKMYKYSGRFDASYLVTIMGDKDSKGLPNSDYSKSSDMKLTWNHTQDPKSNPYGTFTANVQFSTSAYNRNDFTTSNYNPTENTKASSVSYQYHSPTLPLSINTSASINQRSQDSTLSVSFPDMTISVTSIYPFKRKEQIGDQRWYEKIYLSYSGVIKNSINNVKESQFFDKSLVKDWKNGIKHTIPVSASFNLMKYITISASFNYNENWYSNHPTFAYDYSMSKVVPVDTVYGFFRAYNYTGSISMNTKLYGMYKPWSLFGKWTKGVQIRHVLTPSVSFSGAPDFSDPKFGMYQLINTSKDFTHPNFMRQSLYSGNLFSGPGQGQTGATTFSLDNNLEAKVPIAGTDSARKISIIDQLGLSMSYNFLADSLNWSNLNANLRIKLFKSNINIGGQFDTYLYGDNGRPINKLRIANGKGIGRFRGTNFSYAKSFNNETIQQLKKLFTKGGEDSDSSKKGGNSSLTNREGADETEGADENTDTGGESPPAQKSLLNSAKKSEGNYDSDGYLLSEIKWNLSVNYSIGFGYDDYQHFNHITREYPYKISQTLGFNGDISPTQAWKVTFNASYDFAFHRIVNMYCSITRQMHCWSMSASVVPFGPAQNYMFSIAVNSSLLQDVKYQQSSNSRDALNWGN